MAVGGSIESISIRGRLLPVAADADANLDLGGFWNEVRSNGDGSARIIKTRKPWGIDGLPVEIDHDRADLEFLQEIADGKKYETITVTMASGATYQGQGIVTGDLKGSTQNATSTIAIMGKGKAIKQ